jgi:hypothetical protein
LINLTFVASDVVPVVIDVFMKAMEPQKLHLLQVAIFQTHWCQNIGKFNKGKKRALLANH